jgi:AraC-like DNA-binding protein
VTELRLRASLEDVCDRFAPLARVALKSGFSSQSHFTTAFLRRFGTTPAAYRRAI